MYVQRDIQPRHHTEITSSQKFPFFGAPHLPPVSHTTQMTTPPPPPLEFQMLTNKKETSTAL